MDSGIRCRRCGNELKPADAEGPPLSESEWLVHREGTDCGTRWAADDGELLEAMRELEAEGLFEVRWGGDDAASEE